MNVFHVKVKLRFMNYSWIMCLYETDIYCPKGMNLHNFHVTPSSSHIFSSNTLIYIHIRHCCTFSFVHISKCWNANTVNSLPATHQPANIFVNLHADNQLKAPLCLLPLLARLYILSLIKWQKTDWNLVTMWSISSPGVVRLIWLIYQGILPVNTMLKWGISRHIPAPAAMTFLFLQVLQRYANAIFNDQGIKDSAVRYNK